jgi:hypothetical protein
MIASKGISSNASEVPDAVFEVSHKTCDCGLKLQELRKAASQQLRDAHMTQGEVEKALREEQQAAEKREQELKV